MEPLICIPYVILQSTVDLIICMWNVWFSRWDVWGVRVCWCICLLKNVCVCVLPGWCVSQLCHVFSNQEEAKTM